MSNIEKVIVKTYTGDEESSSARFKSDASTMRAKGYFPVSQNYTPGSYGCLSFVAALLLCFIIIGFLIFIYMLIVKPDGKLVVTYEYKDEGKTCPMCAEDVKTDALICRFCGHQFQEYS